MKKLALNSENRIVFGKIFCLFFAIYTVWEMGIVYFASTTLSLYGRSPIILDSTIYLVIIICAYLASIVINSLFVKHTILLAKISGIVSLILTIAVLLPIGDLMTTILLFIIVFICVFMIGLNYNIETFLFDNKSELTYCFIGVMLSSLFIGFLQGGFFNLSYLSFQIISTVLIVLYLLSLFKMPNKIAMKLVTHKEAKKAKAIPDKIKSGLLFAMALACISLLFGITFAETIQYGVGIFYFTGVVAGLISYLLVKKNLVSPFKILMISFSFCTIGFVLAVLSLFYPAISYIAIIFIGVCGIPTALCGFFTNTFSYYSPVRTLGQAITFIGLATALVHSIVIMLFRDNLTALFCTLAVVAIISSSLYTLIESPLSYLWKKISFERPSKTDIVTEAEHSTDLMPQQTEINIKSFEPEIKPNTSFSSLSTREKEVADHILSGYSTSEISKLMFLSENTVKTYRKDLYYKLDIHSRRELFELVEKEAAKKNN